MSVYRFYAKCVLHTKTLILPLCLPLSSAIINNNNNKTLLINKYTYGSIARG